MTEVSASLVMSLRKRTGVGMMECKKALKEANGDIDQAIELLQKAGQAKAEKKGDRVAAEGIIAIASEAHRAVILELNCETDFVARESQFSQFAQDLAQVALANEIQSIDSLLQIKAATFDNLAVEDHRLALVAKLGENIAIRRLKYVQADNGIIGTYLHGGAATARIGSLVLLSKEDDALAKNVAMQVAAMKPEAIAEANLPQERKDKAKEIFTAQVQETQSGKPPEVIAKIVEGKLNKMYKEITLLGQPFVKEPKQTIADLLKTASAEVVEFVRFEVGEGIEKKADDFVSEVMSQVKDSQ